MAVSDDRPDELTDAAQRYAIQRQGSHVYCQGMGQRRSEADPTRAENVFAVWLRMDCGSQAMIGYGSKTEAVAEAAGYLKQMAAMIPDSMDRLVTAMKRTPVNPSR